MTQPLLAAATEALASAGVPSPRVDAELLLAHILGVPRGRLVFADVPDEAATAAFEQAVGRRARREPLQHITGTAPFRRIEVPVGRGVFVPRPETELLVDAVAPALRSASVSGSALGPIAVDLCSGSGALALAIADEYPQVRVVAVERTGPSGDWLLRNTADSRVEPVIGDVADTGLLEGLRGQATAVVCNPPYVPGVSDVAPEVTFDPDIAVFAGVDGLALMSYVIARAAELLRSGGVLAVEHSDTHAEAVPALLDADGRFTGIADHDDLAGRARYATAVRR